MVNSTQKLKRTILNCDILGKPLNFKIRGQDTHKSFLGLFLSSIIMLRVTLYIHEKFTKMINYDDVTLSQELIPGGLPQTENQYIPNLNVAFILYRNSDLGMLNAEDYLNVHAARVRVINGEWI